MSSSVSTPRADLLAFTAFPNDVWTQISSNNPAEKLNKEIRRCTDVVGRLATREAINRHVRAARMDQTDKWVETMRYFGLATRSRCRFTTVPSDDLEEVTEPLALTV